MVIRGGRWHALKIADAEGAIAEAVDDDTRLNVRDSNMKIGIQLDRAASGKLARFLKAVHACVLALRPVVS